MSVSHARRQVFDLPEPRPLVVTEHRAHVCCCPSCGAATRARFPKQVAAPVQYGARTCAFAVYLLHGHFVPEDRLAELMRDLFGMRLVAATIAGMSRNCARRLEGFIEAVRDHVTKAKVKHMDETGFRIGGRTQWLHIFSTSLLTFYRVIARRGGPPHPVSNVVVHDHWKPYYKMTGVLHALCNAHHLRELKALIEIDKEGWARKMQALLRRACHATNLARQCGRTIEASFIAHIQRRYDAIVTEGMVFHHGVTLWSAPERPPRRSRHCRAEIGERCAARGSERFRASKSGLSHESACEPFGRICRSKTASPWTLAAGLCQRHGNAGCHRHIARTSAWPATRPRPPPQWPRSPGARGTFARIAPSMIADPG
jgi:transposase